MVTQQVVAPPARAAVFLVLTVDDGGEEVVRDLLADVSGLARSVSFRNPSDDLVCVVGIGALLWDRLFDLPRPRGLHPFVRLDGPRHVAPSTPGDLLLHVRAHHMDVCFELARQINARLHGHARVVDETHGFKYFDERDLLGFVDGTENPEGEAARDAVTIGTEDPDHAGGSYVIVQKYVHDVVAWESLPVEEQERVMGRTKLDDIEMADDVKPVDSHVALNTVTDDAGDEQQILRANMPFGDIGGGEFGTYFIGYASDPGVIEHMLRNMFLGDPPGNTDRLLDFSTARTGSLFFVPAVDFLDDIPPAGDADDRADARASDDTVSGTPASAGTAPNATASAGTARRDDRGAADLGIGGLRRADTR